MAINQIKAKYISVRRTLKTDKAREQLDVAFDRYEAVAVIASGDDPNRAEHWQQMAGNRLAALNRVIQSLQNGVELSDDEKEKRKKSA